MAFSVQYSVTDTDKDMPAFAWSLEGDKNGEISLESFKAQSRLALIKISREVLRQEQNRGFDRDPIIRVDGIEGRKEDFVRAFGRIEYYSRLGDLEVLLDVYKAIEARSPRRTGQYLASNYVFANNKLVAKNIQEFAKFVEGTKEFGIEEIYDIRFVNVTPYAARLEYTGTRREIRGSKKGMNISRRKSGKSRYKKTLGRKIRKPNGAYYLASRTTSKIKGFFTKVKYEFIPNGFKGIVIDPGGVFRSTYADTPKNRARKRVGKPYVYPSIVFKISKAGGIR